MAGFHKYSITFSLLFLTLYAIITLSSGGILALLLSCSSMIKKLTQIIILSFLFNTSAGNIAVVEESDFLAMLSTQGKVFRAIAAVNIPLLIVEKIVSSGEMDQGKDGRQKNEKPRKKNFADISKVVFEKSFKKSSIMQIDFMGIKYHIDENFFRLGENTESRDHMDLGILGLFAFFVLFYLSIMARKLPQAVFCSIIVNRWSTPGLI